MPKKNGEKYNFIPASEVSAKWFKNPKFVKAYEALEEEFAEMERQIDARQARRERRKAFVKRVHIFWASLLRGLNRIAY